MSPLYSRDSQKGLSYGVVSLLDKVPSGGVQKKEAVRSCGHRLPLAGVPLLRWLLPHGTATLRGRWHKSPASAGVCLQTPFPPFWSRSGTLRRSLCAAGLAGGFQQAVKSFFVIHFAVDLAFLGLVVCLAA